MSQPLSQLAAAAAKNGGAAIREAANKPRQITSKGFRDEVTDADYAAQAAIVATIHEQYPDHLIVSEEDAMPSNLPAGQWWVIDPLDGTTNYSRAIPQYCVSVAAMQGKTVLSGAIYDPQREHLFVAEQGGGVTLNGEPLHVTTRNDIAEAVVECGLARKPAVRLQALAAHNTLAIHCRSVRGLGSAALSMAYIAAGWLDGYFHISLNAWDVAAAALMIREAGGRITRLDGRPWQPQLSGGAPLLATNGILHNEILALTREALEM